MKYQFRNLFLFVLLSMPLLVSAQAVIVSSPGAWVTQRNDTIVVRAQIDTSLLEKKEIKLKLNLVKNGKKRVLAAKTFKVKDNMGEFSFGGLNKDVLGGTEFMELGWTIPGKDESGSVRPVGIVNLDKKMNTDKLIAQQVKDESGINNAASNFKNPDKIGDFEFITAWDTDNLYIIFKKSEQSGTVNFLIDGKNGKNAFLSYPDRIISYNPSKDSVKGFHYKREVRDDSLIYSEKIWKHEITTRIIDNKTLIVIPWADAGIIPFEGRKNGFGVFALNSKNKVIGSIPGKAEMDIPGTWTDLVLQK